MGQNARLRRDFIFVDDAIKHIQQGANGRHAVGRRIDADHGVAAAIEQAVENARRDAGRIVGRMIWLQSRRQAPGSGLES